MNDAMADVSMCSMKISAAKPEVDAPIARPCRWRYIWLLNMK